jgi:hypothetical protein
MNIEQRIREALAEHQLCLAWEGGEGVGITCACGLDIPLEEQRREIDLDALAAHQASVLAGIVQPELFEAYELGRDHEFAKSALKQQIPENPYRKEDG